jgi:hypothetical protein
MKQEESKNPLWTKNMFLESCYELNLSLAEDITVVRINEAFDKFEDEIRRCIQKNIAPPFDLKTKEIAKEYLIERLSSKFN